MFSRQRLFWSRDPYDLERTQERFVQAVADNCAWHMGRCPEYRAIAQGLGFSPKTLVEAGDLSSWCPPCSSSATPCSPCPSGGWG